MFYTAPFDVTETDFGTITIGTSGKTSVAITISALTGTSADGTSSIFFHYPSTTTTSPITSEDWTLSTRLRDISQGGFGGALQTALRAGATSNSWTSPSGITVQWRRTVSPYSYRIAYPTANFTVTWSNAVGRSLMGFTANTSGSTTYDGTATPSYVINPTLSLTSESTMNFEPSNIGNHLIADDGSGYGIDRYVSPLYRDWTQQYETKAKTARLFAASTHPWTFQHLFEQCRGRLPFMVIDGFGATDYEVFSFRTEGMNWQPERASTANDSQFHIPFKTIVEGSLTSSL